MQSDDSRLYGWEVVLESHLERRGRYTVRQLTVKNNGDVGGTDAPVRSPLWSHERWLSRRVGAEKRKEILTIGETSGGPDSERAADAMDDA